MISLGELGPSDTAIIREVYDSDNAPEIFEMELERALQVTEVTISSNNFESSTFTLHNACLLNSL